MLHSNNNCDIFLLSQYRYCATQSRMPYRIVLAGLYLNPEYLCTKIPERSWTKLASISSLRLIENNLNNENILGTSAKFKY